MPASYQDFIRVFGPGELGEGFLIKAPGYGQVHDPVDLLKFTERTREAVRGNYPDEARLARFWYFGTTTGADLIGWDPKDVTDRLR